MQQAGNDESSNSPHNQSTVGQLLEGQGSTVGTPRLCIAGIARVHMEHCQKWHPLGDATFYMLATYLSACISMLLS